MTRSVRDIPYQAESVEKVSNRFSTAIRRYKADGTPIAFSLSAPTGAGKTVILANVFDALLFGKSEIGVEDIPKIIFLWFSDSPALNAQSLHRIKSVADRINPHLITLDNDSLPMQFEAGKIYFLNTQKLSKNSNMMKPIGDRTYTFWDTLRTTLSDENTTLCMVFDEAHKRLGKKNGAEKKTIVNRLIHGHNDIHPIPVVCGMSATPMGFDNSMLDKRGTEISVKITWQEVQESGLVKDFINIDMPSQTGGHHIALAKEGGKRLRKISLAWEEYAKKNPDSEKVAPLMVLQVENNPDFNKIGDAIDAICEGYPELKNANAIAQVFSGSEGSIEQFGKHVAPYVYPQDVQGNNEIRVLVAKTAIDTGWDCPRAEVLVSFRSAQDPTNIAQMLGRMLRTPLARRIDGDEILNSVDCILPYYNASEVGKFIDEVKKLDEENPLLIPINTERYEMVQNPDLPAEIWQLFASLPSYMMSHRYSTPLKRLMKWVALLLRDDIARNERADTIQRLCDALDGFRAKNKVEFKQKEDNIREWSLEGIGFDRRKRDTTSKSSVTMQADKFSVADAYARAKNKLGGDLCNAYCNSTATDDSEDALYDARIAVAALADMDDIIGSLDDEAGKLINELHAKYRLQIMNLPEAKQAEYDSARQGSGKPEEVSLAIPKSWNSRPSPKKMTDEIKRIEKKHLLCGDGSMLPSILDLKRLELDVALHELSHPDTIAWYRNPPTKKRESLGIPYKVGDNNKIMRPDFIFFSEAKDGSIQASIIDPHGSWILSNEDNPLARLKGLAKYANDQADKFYRIEAIDKFMERLYVLDMLKADVRKAVNKAKSADEVEALYTKHGAIYRT